MRISLLAYLLLLSAGPGLSQGNCSYSYDSGSTTGAVAAQTFGVTGWISVFDAGVTGDVIEDISSSFGSPINAPNATNGFNARFGIWDDPNNDGDPSDAVLLWTMNAAIQNADTDMLVKIPVPSLQVTNKFFAGVLSGHPPGNSPAPEDMNGSAQPGESWLAGHPSTNPPNFTDLTGYTLTPHSASWRVRVNCCLPGFLCRGFEWYPSSGVTLACVGDDLLASTLNPAGSTIETHIGAADGFGLRVLQAQGLPINGRIGISMFDALGNTAAAFEVVDLPISRRITIGGAGSSVCLRLFHGDHEVAVLPSVPLPFDVEVDLPNQLDIRGAIDSLSFNFGTDTRLLYDGIFYTDITTIIAEALTPGGFGTEISDVQINTTGITDLEIESPHASVFGVKVSAESGLIDIEQGLSGQELDLIGTGGIDILNLEANGNQTGRHTDLLGYGIHLPNWFFLDETQGSWKGIVNGTPGQNIGFTGARRVGLDTLVYGGLSGLPGSDIFSAIYFNGGTNVGELHAQNSLNVLVPQPPNLFSLASNTVEKSGGDPERFGLCIAWDTPVTSLVPGLGSLTFDCVYLQPRDWCIGGVEGVSTTAMVDPVTGFKWNGASSMGTFSLGETYCDQTAANSVGLLGKISASGRSLLSLNDFWLCASCLPPNKFGFFLGSLGMSSNMPAGVSTNICVGSMGLPIGRFNAQVQTSGQNGCFWIPVDLLAPPPPFTFQVLDILKFQAWYRDVGGTSNFTNAIQVPIY